MLRREIIQTADGSPSIFIPEWNEHYHSHHGAWQEAKHVFMQNGLNLKPENEISVLELGFGTGLNALLSVLNSPFSEQKIHYQTFEKFPVSLEEIQQLQFGELLNQEQNQLLEKLHTVSWNEKHTITSTFSFTKFNSDFFLIEKHIPENSIDLVFFDCFGARVQPELWEETLALQIVKTMKNNALLTTYSSKGSFRRILQELGLNVQKIQGPKGKREMINAWKP